MENQIQDTSRTTLGRSGPRSRNGCQMCKQRRVRCNEQRPSCSACIRLKLDCVYEPPPPRRRRSTSYSFSGTGVSRRKRHDSGQSHDPGSNDQPPRQGSISAQELLPVSPHSALIHQYPSPTQSQSLTPKAISESVNSQAPSSQLYDEGMEARMQQSGVSMPADQSHQYLPNAPSLDYFDTLFDNCFEIPDMSNAFSTFAFTDAQQYHQPHSGSSPSAFYGSSDLLQANLQLDGPLVDALPNQLFQSVSGQRSLGYSSTLHLAGSNGRQATFDYTSLTADQQQHLKAYFKRNIRPPASLVSVDPLGWFGMQRYLVHLASGNRAVANALFALALLLFSSDGNYHPPTVPENSRSTISNLQKASRREIETELVKSGSVENGDGLLAAIFLLAWCNVGFSTHEFHLSTVLTFLRYFMMNMKPRTQRFLLKLQSLLLPARRTGIQPRSVSFSG